MMIEKVHFILQKPKSLYNMLTISNIRLEIDNKKLKKDNKGG